MPPIADELAPLLATLDFDDELEDDDDSTLELDTILDKDDLLDTEDALDTDDILELDELELIEDCATINELADDEIAELEAALLGGCTDAAEELLIVDIAELVLILEDTAEDATALVVDDATTLDDEFKLATGEPSLPEEPQAVSKVIAKGMPAQKAGEKKVFITSP